MKTKLLITLGLALAAYGASNMGSTTPTAKVLPVTNTSKVILPLPVILVVATKTPLVVPTMIVPQVAEDKQPNGRVPAEIFKDCVGPYVFTDLAFYNHTARAIWIHYLDTNMDMKMRWQWVPANTMVWLRPFPHWMMVPAILN